MLVAKAIGININVGMDAIMSTATNKVIIGEFIVYRVISKSNINKIVIS